MASAIGRHAIRHISMADFWLTAMSRHPILTTMVVSMFSQLFPCYGSVSSCKVYCLLQVSLYLDKFSGVCQSVLHECKLTFLQIICDHDLFVEMPGRDPSDR